MLTSKAFWLAALERALKTFAQTIIALVGTVAVGITTINWADTLGIGATAAVLSVLTSITSIKPVVDPPADPVVQADAK